MNNELYQNLKEYIIEKIGDKWQSLCQKFYVCYSVKDLAYKISYELLDYVYGECNNAIFCKKIQDKWSIAIYFEEEIYFTFDIWWATGMFGDTGLHIGYGVFASELSKDYEDIEDFFEEE